MYELIGLTENDYYAQSPAKIGIVKLGGNEVCFIDSGNDKDAGRKLRQLLERNGWKLKAIYNTHSNADHIGGNSYLQAQTGCRIFAYGAERAFTEFPILEPSFLYGGFPSAELRRKFLLAQESKAEPLTNDVLPDGFEIIPLTGHFFDMVGFRTPDDTVYLADCLSSRETLDKYGIGFIYDVKAYLETLQTVKTMKAKRFVPSHADVTEDISELAQYNIDKVTEIANKIVDFCYEPVNFEKLLQMLFYEYSLTMNFEQHALIGSTVRSYLSYLKEEGRVTACFKDNMLLWESVKA